MPTKVARLIATIAEIYAAAVAFFLFLSLPLPTKLTRSEWESWIILLMLTLSAAWTARALHRRKPVARRVAIVLGLYGALMLGWRTWEWVKLRPHLDAIELSSYLIACSGLLALVIGMIACLLSDMSLRENQVVARDER